MRRWTAVALLIAGLPVTACGQTSEEGATAHHDPAKIEPIAGTDVSRLTLTARAVERLAIQTAPVGQDRGRKVVPYGSVLYDTRGNTFAYTSPSPRVFVREPITVDRIQGERALLSDGPAYGTQVVRVGAAELLGTEFEVGH
jgi:hypothetical protein